MQSSYQNNVALHCCFFLENVDINQQNFPYVALFWTDKIVTKLTDSKEPQPPVLIRVILYCLNYPAQVKVFAALSAGGIILFLINYQCN